MAISSKIYEGDQGQRYKIEAFDQSLMSWRSVAYTNILDSAKSIAESIILRPNWIKSRIMERSLGPTSSITTFDIIDNQIGNEYLQPSTLKLQ